MKSALTSSEEGLFCRAEIVWRSFARCRCAACYVNWRCGWVARIIGMREFLASPHTQAAIARAKKAVKKVLGESDIEPCERGDRR